MSTTLRWNKLRHVHLGLCLTIVSATFAVLVPGPGGQCDHAYDDVDPAVPGHQPPARDYASMAYDSGTGQLVLFGGYDSSSGGFLNDTWTWNGTTWTQQSPTTSPPARDFASMAYDSVTGQLVLFGGLGSSGELNDTWTWNGTTWTQQSPATSPSARDFASMAYDSVTGQLVLFGGQSSSGNLNDTWTYGYPVPTTKQQCKHGGWHSYSQFKNQGQCVRFVNTGK